MKGSQEIKETQNKRKIKSQAKLREVKGSQEMKETQNKRKIKSQANLKEVKGSQEMKETQNKHKVKNRAKSLVEKGPQNIRIDQNNWKRLNRKRRQESEPETLHLNEKVRKRLSRKKQLNENSQKDRDDQNRWQLKSRLIDSEKKRLTKFRRSTMFNAIFTCMCCHRNLFECNVSKFTIELLTQIESKKPGLYGRSIDLIDSSPVKVNINGVEESYLCLA